jgi:hypothetical protein
VGGHCLPIDPSYLSWRVERALGQQFRFVELANDINSHMPDYVVNRLLLALNARQQPVSGSRILLLGLAYKKNTGDARESPAIRVAELLVRIGADVRAADPLVTEPAITHPAVAHVDATPQEIAAADAVVLLTDHDVFTKGDICRHARYVLDCRRGSFPLRTSRRCKRSRRRSASVGCPVGVVPLSRMLTGRRLGAWCPPGGTHLGHPGTPASCVPVERAGSYGSSRRSESAVLSVGAGGAGVVDTLAALRYSRHC